MKNQYAAIIEQNLTTLFTQDSEERAGAMGAGLEGRAFVFKAFGGQCRMTAREISINGRSQDGPAGIIISLYALNADSSAMVMQPFKAFKEFPNSMPYVGAFASHTEQILIPAVDRIANQQENIMEALAGQPAPDDVSGDFAIVVRPFPKIGLCYIFYEADEDFPASVTCLYSHNADSFMPMDGLADVGEYTSRAMLDILR